MVYRYMGRHDAAWLAKVEAHVLGCMPIPVTPPNRGPRTRLIS